MERQYSSNKAKEYCFYSLYNGGLFFHMLYEAYAVYTTCKSIRCSFEGKALNNKSKAEKLRLGIRCFYRPLRGETW